MSGDTVLRAPGRAEAAQLAALLRVDEILRAELCMGATPAPSAAELLERIERWAAPRSATTWAIVDRGRVAGTISLSHRDFIARSARIGYWIGSGHRRRGLATRAVADVLAIAAAEGLVSVSATVAAGNLPSRRIWERLGARAGPGEGGKVEYQLGLAPSSRYSASGRGSTS